MENKILWTKQRDTTVAQKLERTKFEWPPQII